MQNHRGLANWALLVAIYLSATLTRLGLEKFDYILAGGQKFATFSNWGNHLGISLSYVLLYSLYLTWTFSSQLQNAVTDFKAALQRSWIFLLLAFIAYPLGNDVYIYLHSGLMNLRGGNPFLTPLGSYASELFQFVDWGQTSTYGPLSQLLFTASALFVSISPLLAVYVYKSFCLGLHILNGYLIWKQLVVPERGKVTLAYLLNPLLLMEQVAGAHIDVLVSTSLILLVGSLTRKWYTAAVIALWAGFLSKTLPIVWMPLVLTFLCRKHHWKALWQAGFVSLGFVILLSWKVLPELSAWRSLLNPGVAGQYLSSIPAFVMASMNELRQLSLLPLSVAQQKAWLAQLVQGLTIGFGLFYMAILIRIWRKQNYLSLNLIADMGWVTLVLFLLATSWLMPWYASIVITFAALQPRAPLFGMTALIFGLSSSMQYLFQGNPLMRSLVTISLPVLVLFLGKYWLQQRRSPQVSHPPTSAI
ncbi:hypothetical protein [Pantanalinema sp. GBBB05]|uniref:hypothetical protein n=1 Tax=Pantanalinema sp. GBBB05 TaxID=2604139 RepID=UPI001DBF849D|nr:hypothetical protein [Pantanalinema sp. GBBB05]